MSKFRDSMDRLAGKKVRFYLGGGDKGIVQGPVEKVDGNLIFIQKEGDIRGTLHTISVNAEMVRYYEIDIVSGSK